MKVGVVSLGCSKNLVDSEMLIGLFQKEKFELVQKPEEADILIVNTCGFIESAKEEAINTILEMAEFKKIGKCQYLIAIGCLVKRYKKELEKSLPEVDLFVSVDEYENIWNKIEDMLGHENKKKSNNTLDYLERVIATGNTTAYLKIAEGCSNCCTYCAIPSIRGPYVSRPLEDVLQEAERLAGLGYKEIIVIAQDTTKYGIDLYGEPKLAELLEKLCQIEGFRWIRFLYAYPESITDELIEVVKKNEKICHYFDIPLQHFSDKILKRMNRKSNAKAIEELMIKLRREIPDVIIRTTMIVGFPGETEADFTELYEFIKRAKFEKLGVFQYSKEDGTPAERLPEQIHYKTKQKRWNLVMRRQNEISQANLQEKVGSTLLTLIDGFTDDGKYAIGRSYMDIPDEDGVIYMQNNQKVKEGDFVECEIIKVNGYDLLGKLKQYL